jgi:membrane-associated phospholipid phosphatase
MHGIITFPSFHATLGILFIHATRRTVLFIPSVVINVGMIMATPTIGGHHFIDVPAGLAIGFIGCTLYSLADKAVRSWRQSAVASTSSFTLFNRS